MSKSSIALSAFILGAASGLSPMHLSGTGLQPTFVNAQEQLAQSGMIDGEVRKLDMSAGKITIRHGPIPKYDMGTPMTMVFPARDPSILRGLNVGDKILFDVEKEGGSLTVTQIKKAN